MINNATFPLTRVILKKPFFPSACLDVPNLVKLKAAYKKKKKKKIGHKSSLSLSVSKIKAATNRNK